MCVLPDNRLLSVNFDNRNLTIYDEEFNLIKTVDKISGEAFWPFGAVLNDKNQLYIIDFENDRIILTDLDFRRIKTVGKKSININDCAYIYSAYFKDERLYVCEKKQMKLKVFSTDLDLISVQNLEFKPCFIKCSDSYICITDDLHVYFYYLNNFTLKCVIDICNARISEINSYFFVYCSEDRFYDCFDSNGDFTERVHFDRFNDYKASNRDGVLIYFRDNLIMTFRESKLLLKFK